MSKLNNLTDFLTSLANKIREKLGTTEVINPQDFDSKVDEVYSHGYNTGYLKIYDNPSAYMNPTEYIIKFNEVRNNAYIYAFSGLFWGESQNFKLPYEGISEVTNGHGMFKYSGITSLNTSYVEGDSMPYNGIDFSKAVYPNQMFRYSLIEELGYINFSGALGLSATFGDMSKLHTISRLVPPVNENTTYYITFDNTPKLENISFGGFIKNSISFATNKSLNKESIQNIINFLSDDVSGKTAYLNTNAVKKQFETSDGANDGDQSEEWQSLIATKQNWNIVLSTAKGLV